MAIKKRNRKNILFSSFDRAIVTIILKNKRDGMLLIKDEAELIDLDFFKKICINQNLLSKVDFTNKEIYVYDVKKSDVEQIKQTYPLIKAIITDY
jgi:hypothetical protein